VRTAVQNVHERNGQQRRLRATEISIERQTGIDRSGACAGHRHGQDGIGAQLRLGWRTVEGNHDLIDAGLIDGVQPEQCRRNRFGYVAHRFLHPFAEVAVFVAVTQLEGFVLAG
jgi:hypothetical protein